MEELKEAQQVNIAKKINANIVTAHGRRKEAVAKVRLSKGKGDFTVNGIPIEKYFQGIAAKALWQKPFIITKTESDYSASVKVSGSGKIGQLGAMIHGFSRALSLINPELRPTLKKAGFLTRDSRAKESRKFGRAQKARKGKQSPKR